MAANPDKVTITRQHGTRAIIFAAAREPGTNRLFLGDSEFKVSAGDPTGAKWEPKEIGKHESYVTGVVLAGKHLVTCGYDGRVCWWDPSAARLVRTVEASKKWLRGLSASPDGGLVCAVGDDMTARLYEAGTGKLVRELRGHREKTPSHFPSMLFVSAFSPDGKHLATADKVGHVVVWEVATGKQATTLEAPQMYTWDPRQRIHSIGGVRSLAFSPDGKRLAAGGIGQIGNVDHLDGKARVEVFDWQAGKRTHEFAKTKFNGLVEQLVFHPRDAWLLAVGGSNDGLCFFMDLAGNKVVKELKVDFHVHAALLKEDGETILVAGYNRVAVLEMKG